MELVCQVSTGGSSAGPSRISPSLAGLGLRPASTFPSFAGACVERRSCRRGSKAKDMLVIKSAHLNEHYCKSHGAMVVEIPPEPIAGRRAFPPAAIEADVAISTFAERRPYCQTL